jgi:iron complex outermembrane receptor protein
MRSIFGAQRPRRPSPSFQPRAVALAVVHGAMMAAGLTAGVPAAPAYAQAAPATRVYAIAAGPLTDVLNRFGREAGLLLSFSTAQTQGLRSGGVQGSYGVVQALQAVLEGTGLEAVAQPGGGYVIRAAPAAATSPSVLPAVTVVGRNDAETATGPLHGYAATRSATAMKTDTPILETPQSVSVIGRDELDARGAQDVMDAVRYTPGITTNIYGPDNRSWEDIQIRGFSSYYGGFRDGLAQTPSGVTYYLTEPYGLERVEVMRGPASMVFGQGDAGGVINRVSKMPAADPVREVELQYGSFDRRQLAFDLGDRIGASDLSFRLVGLTLDTNDQDQYPDGRKLNRTRQYLAPSLRWQPNAGTSLTLLGEYIKDVSAEDPYYVNANGVYTNAKMGDYSFSGIRQEQGALGYRFESALDDRWTLRHNLRHSELKIDRRVVWADSLDTDGHTLHRIARTWNDPLSQTAIDTQLQGRLRTGSVEHTVLLGVDWNEQRVKARRFIGAAPDLDLNAPVYGQAIALPAIPLARFDQTNRQLGVYAQDQLRLDEHWLLSLGGRQDKVTSATDDALNATRTDRRDTAFSGRAGLTYLVGNGWAPYVSHTESFLPTSGVDALNQPFKPSRGKQTEAGVKYQPAGGDLLVTGAVFDLRKTNVVSYDPVTFEGRQIGEQRSRGIELEAKGRLAPRLNVIASYTWVDLKVTRSSDPDELGKTIPGVPRQSAALWLDYLLDGGLGVGAGLRYIGPRANDEYNTSFVGGVALLDAGVHWEQGRWRLALNVGNLLDRKYFSICYHGECYRGTERAATFTARYNF